MGAIQRFDRAMSWLSFVVCSAAMLAPVPARAEAPPLIPRDILFATPRYDWPQLSPDGRRIGYIAPSEAGIPNVWVRTVGATDDSMITDDTHGGIGFFQWAWNGRHLLYLQDRAGNETLHLWSVDLATREQRDLTPFDGVRAQNLLLGAARPDEVLIGLNRRDPRTFDMYRVDLASGDCRLDTQNPGDVLGWTTDANLTIRAATAFDPTDGHTTVRVRDAQESPWRELLTTTFEDTPIVGQLNGGSNLLGFDQDGRSLFMASYRGSETTRLVRIDATNGREIETLAHRDKADLWAHFGADRILRYQALFDPKTAALQAVAFEEGTPEWLAVDPGVKGDLTTLGKASAPGLFDVISQDRDSSRWIVATFSAERPWAFSIYDRKTRKLEKLFDASPHLAGVALAPVEPVRFAARDGLSLLAYLTLPRGVPASKLPMVLYVHGGPWTRDHWEYDPSVQWLANRGYAVLQVQFRGSAGLGKTYLNAGNGQWGVGAMQHDLTDAVRWAVQKGIADPKRVAIMGGSYGGYATLSGLAFTPDVYACGVDIVGPSNVATTLASFPTYWAPVKKRWIMRIGDVEKDAALNERISPLFHADAIRVPLLIGHGTNDPRVKQEESEKIVKVLRDRGLPVTFIVYPDEGHGFGRTENNLDFFGRAEDFLAKHIGGRAEPWVAVEGSSVVVR